MIDTQLTLPNPTITTSNQHSASVLFSGLLPSPGFTNRYDPEGDFIAIGCNNGQKLLYSIAERKIVQEVTDQAENPVTCIRWRPTVNSKTRVIGVGLADGRFEYWHVPSMKKMFGITEPDNSILCCDFDRTGERFATSGKDCSIRVYDQQTKSISAHLGRAEWNYSGHSNRVFSVKFIDENTLISGGWDSVIHIWDLRHAKSAKSFYGPHLAGDSLDFRDNTILTGCYSAKNQIQTWDIRTLQQVANISWPCEKDQVAYVYSACFGRHHSNAIIAGASGVNEVRVLTGAGQTYSTALKVGDLKQGCYSVDSSHRNNQICLSTAKQGFYVVGYQAGK